MSITEAFDAVAPSRPAPPTVGVSRPARPAAARVTPKQRATVRRDGRLRRMVRVVYLDAADSWIVRESSPAPRTVWRTDYTAHLISPPTAYVRWCRVWRYPGTVLGATCDGLKFFLIHPVRGPLAIVAGSALTVIALH